MSTSHPSDRPLRGQKIPRKPVQTFSDHPKNPSSASPLLDNGGIHQQSLSTSTYDSANNHRQGSYANDPHHNTPSSSHSSMSHSNIPNSQLSSSMFSFFFFFAISSSSFLTCFGSIFGNFCC